MAYFLSEIILFGGIKIPPGYSLASAFCQTLAP